METKSEAGTEPGGQNLHGTNSRLVQQEEQRQDLGFGAKISDAYSRLVNKDGSFNIDRVNERFWDRINLYNRLITMSWWQFLGWVLVFYFVVNGVFAGIYLLVGAENLQSSVDGQPYGSFWKAFFFSSQTMTTVGYGHIAPVSFLASIIAAMESMIGLLSFALVTGLLYGRFSRPLAHVRFSKGAVFAPYLDVNAWMFRVVNSRANQLIDVEMEVSLSRLEAKPDGTRYRRYHALKLERSKVAFFPTNWTLVHPITETSPLYGCTPEELAAADAEFLILFRAMDDTFSQQVHSRTSYRYDEVRWGHTFVPMFDGAQHGMVALDLNKLDDTKPAKLNL
ncbi:inward rectifier potassium channel [Spirosoma oryzae]|uniref:Inward rectifier potassium channel n=1 Tax=Spirosoma oryzae TaxID=1469603 RepID=A0A2T0SMP7_9BACT|nr:ion channel [Spirosoma oryzae]PRY34689.1 inward rectifier potassium channel [Spirosoma oryzae]